MATPAERSTNARIAANTRWSRETNRTGATAKARGNSPASLQYWLKKVDPDQLMPYADRVKNAESAMKAYYQAAMRKARQAKAAKKSGEAA